MKPFLLASGSPRRKELLEQAHLSFSVKTSSIEEFVDPNLTPADVVQSLSLQKAEAVAKVNKDAVVLGSDTVVVLDNEILGKPRDESDAKSMLQKLSGSTHKVFTGVAITDSETTKTFYSETNVTFYELSDEEIDFYIATDNPLDKAGSYGIQDFGATFVKEIHGDYFAVVGLPIASTVKELKAFGITPFK
ncbi:Maf family protein [Bacillus sp. FJAT-45350]|uniref:Maf family protein n=1 Tax=Bacillus sp. FJAT-45350 TaxID=2011014 RepID=UPI000BB84DFE|nr:Maf family protein [Bacillus sp. FJAT-45350]